MTTASPHAERRCSGAARVATQETHSPVTRTANSLGPPRCNRGGPATLIVPPGRGSLQGSAPTSIFAVWITPLPSRESTQSRWKLPSGGAASEM